MANRKVIYKRTSTHTGNERELEYLDRSRKTVTLEGTDKVTREIDICRGKSWVRIPVYSGR